jgi:hypothetical protein
MELPDSQTLSSYNFLNFDLTLLVCLCFWIKTTGVERAKKG